jgi:hypothetical protein
MSAPYVLVGWFYGGSEQIKKPLAKSDLEMKEWRAHQRFPQLLETQCVPIHELQPSFPRPSPVPVHYERDVLWDWTLLCNSRDLRVARANNRSIDKIVTHYVYACARKILDRCETQRVTSNDGNCRSKQSATGPTTKRPPNPRHNPNPILCLRCFLWVIIHRCQPFADVEVQVVRMRMQWERSTKPSSLALSTTMLLSFADLWRAIHTPMGI